MKRQPDCFYLFNIYLSDCSDLNEEKLSPNLSGHYLYSAFLPNMII